MDHGGRGSQPAEVDAVDAATLVGPASDTRAVDEQRELAEDTTTGGAMPTSEALPEAVRHPLQRSASVEPREALADAPGAVGPDEGASENAPGGASHDLDLPEPLRELMARGWAAPVDDLPPQAAVAPYAAVRRDRLAALFPGETLVVPSGRLKVRSNDTDYPFRPSSDFVWLTGCQEPDAALVIDATGAAVLYVADRSDRSGPAFYSDRRYGELWVGPRRGVRETAAALGVECRPLEELTAALDRLAPATTRVLRGVDEIVDARVRSVDARRDSALAEALSEHRLFKDDREVAELERAVAATVRGFGECARELPRARRCDRGERWLEGTFFRRARSEGNDVGYGSIVATGPHATTLHWVRNDGRVRAGDLALLDMGVEADSLYTADVTRTLPVDGRFRDAQRRVYDVVMAAQQAGIDAVRPGADFLAAHRAAMAVIADALDDWGLLTVPAAESLRDEVGLHRRYTLHGTSHMLGLDVHDCAQARKEAYRQGTLAAGMVLTVEPGLYFQPDDLTVPEELRGIGVRIEDDVLVVDGGCRVLSEDLPRAAEDVERWTQECAQA